MGISVDVRRAKRQIRRERAERVALRLADLVRRFCDMEHLVTMADLEEGRALLEKIDTPGAPL